MVSLIVALLLAAGVAAERDARARQASSRRTIISVVPHSRRDGAALRAHAGRRDRGHRRGRGVRRVSIQGAHGDLLEGLENAARDANAATDVWVSAAGSYNLLMTTPFAPMRADQARKAPGREVVGLYRGGLLDEGDRRIW